MSESNVPAPEEAELYARDEVSFGQLGPMIEDLAEQLQSVARRAAALDVMKDINEVDRLGVSDEDIHAELDRRIDAVKIRTLSGLKQFRRNYEYAERAIAEWALLGDGVTQRDVARYLGVATSTVNRWAQNPLSAQTDSK